MNEQIPCEGALRAHGTWRRGSRSEQAAAVFFYCRSFFAFEICDVRRYCRSRGALRVSGVDGKNSAHTFFYAGVSRMAALPGSNWRVMT
eukprot:3752629-Pleurochrysis_carterae.AAC.1